MSRFTEVLFPGSESLPLLLGELAHAPPHSAVWLFPGGPPLCPRPLQIEDTSLCPHSPALDWSQSRHETMRTPSPMPPPEAVRQWRADAEPGIPGTCQERTGCEGEVVAAAAMAGVSQLGCCAPLCASLSRHCQLQQEVACLQPSCLPPGCLSLASRGPHTTPPRFPAATHPHLPRSSFAARREENLFPRSHQPPARAAWLPGAPTSSL